MGRSISPPFSVSVIDQLWSGAPTPSFLEGSTTAYSSGQKVVGYNSTTDEFRVTPGYTLPGWLGLTLSGTGAGDLTPSGSQLDADDFTLRLDVRRSGGAWVSSAAFGVTVTAAPATLGTLTDLAFEGKRPIGAFIDPQTGQSGGLLFGKHTNFQFCPDDGKIYGYGGDGVYVGTGNNSSTIHLSRLSFSGAPNFTLTYDNPYPWWGTVGVRFPVNQDSCPFMYDSARGCFWIVGGYYAGLSAAGGADPRIIGVKARYGVWRFWTRGPLAGQYEEVVPFVEGSGSQPGPPANAHGEGMSGNYVPGIDCLVWTGTSVHWLYWYKCSDGSLGQSRMGAYAESVQIFPGVAVGKEGANVCGGQSVYDPVNNELIWASWNGTNDFNGLYATSLDNWPGTPLTTRQLYRDGSANISSAFGQQPLWIRGRKLYTSHMPKGYANAGFGLGFLEIDLDSPTPQATVKAAAQPAFENQTSGYPEHPAWPINEGAYDPVKDIFVATPSETGTAPFVFRWTAPSWTPAAGNVSAITINVDGTAVNTFNSVAPASGVYSSSGIRLAWAGACYAKDLSTNGVMLVQGGGDGDYWGNEICCFDFDTRRWSRLSDPSTAMTGVVVNDRAAAPSASTYWNRGECEHGPDPTVTAGWTSSTIGLLPAGTQPGVPHLYDGMMYLPGSVMGNLRGALVRPYTQVAYTTDGTGRAHYFDLDNSTAGGRKGWGRFSSNKGGPDQNPLIAGQLPIIGYDEELGRIYHSYGYLDVTTRQHTNRTWTNRSIETKGCFDPERRLWLMPRVDGFGEYANTTPGTLRACAVDSSSIFSELTFAFTGGSAAWLRGQAWMAGFEYFPPLDCFFFYNRGSGNPAVNIGGVAWSTRQKIWKIQPPSVVVGQPSTYYLSQPWTVTEITMPGVSVSASAPQGTYSTFFYVPPLKCLAIFNGYTEPMYLYKPEGL